MNQMNQTKVEAKEDNQSNKDDHFINVQSKIARINHFVVDGTRIPFPPELKFYYGYFYTWAIQVDKVCPSKELIAEQMGESKPTAMKRINALVDLGLLRIETEGRKHVYYLTMPDEVLQIAHGTITAKAVSKKPKAVKKTSPQEPEQPATIPALPSDVVQNETEKTNEEDELQSLFESYRGYCLLERLDEKAYESNFGDFYDETFRPELAETFKRFMPFLMSYDWDEESEIFEDLGIPF